MIETDNNGDVRRGAKHIKQSGHKFISDKSYKEKIKKLSAVNRANWREQENYEMACIVADREEALHSHSPSLSGAPSKKFKLPRKQFLDDRDGVDHVSVPRKLRSAMKKRSGESKSPTFPDSKKLSYSDGGVKSMKKVGVKRSKLNLKQGGQNWSLQQRNGPITKDEEEVAETLYALAGMFPNNETDNRSKKGSAFLDASVSALTGPDDSHTQKLKAREEDINSNCPFKLDEAVNLDSDIERLPEKTIQACSLNGASIHQVSNFSSNEELHGLDTSIARVKLNKILDINEEQKLLGNSVKFCFPLQQHQDNGKLKQPDKIETSLLETKPEIALGLTATFSQLRQQHMSDEPINNASWMGSSSTSSSTSFHGPLSQTCAAKVPVWFGTRPCSLQNDSSTGNIFKVLTDRRSWKKCASHIYISQLIKALQMPETKESFVLLPNKLKPQEILKRSVLATKNDFNIKNDLIGVKSPSRVVETCKLSPNNIEIGNLQHLRIHQGHSEADLASGAYPSQKHNFNFLSLSAGGGGIESNISYNRAGSCPESLAKLQIPYCTQNPSLVPFSMYQPRGSSAFAVRSSASAEQQAQLQLSPHFSNAYCAAHAIPIALTKQQQLWASQLAQYRNTGTSTAIMHFPILQNGRQDSSAIIPCIASSPPTMELLRPKYPHISHYEQLQQHQHQHQQFVSFSVPHGRMKKQDQHLSSAFEETEVGYRASGSALSMQLLCNEHL